jgi:hypothetical protein
MSDNGGYEYSSWLVVASFVRRGRDVSWMSTLFNGNRMPVNYPYCGQAETAALPH